MRRAAAGALACSSEPIADAGPAGDAAGGGAVGVSGAGSTAAGGGGAGGSSASGSAAAGSGATATPSAISKRAACRGYLEAICARRESCGWRHGGARCLSEFVGEGPDFLFAEGSTRTVADVLACTETYRTFECAMLNQGLVPECAGALGTLADGERCAFNSQCASTACGGPFAASSCETCGPRVMPSAPALGGGEGDACTGAGCYAPLQCVPDLEGETRCAPAPALSEACLFDIGFNSCAQGAYCSRQMRCTALPEQGEPCSPVWGAHCAPGLGCHRVRATPPEEGTCIPAAGAGEACGDASSQWGCATGLRCELVPGSGTCVADRAEGEPCADSFARCEGGTTCQGGACVALDSLGLVAERCAP